MTRPNFQSGWAFKISEVSAAIVIMLSPLLGLYIFMTGGFWGAPLPLLLVQIFWVSVVPLVAIPLAFQKAKSFAVGDRRTLASFVIFIPMFSQLILGPPLVFLTGKVWWFVT